MWQNKWVRLLALLIVANIGYYLYLNWGLVTLKVKDAPLREVISSIEWQTWPGPKIYTNLPLDSKVTMYVDHVPLAEAMETLAVNVDVPPPPDGGDDNARPRRQPPAGADGSATNNAPNAAPVAQNGPGGQTPPGAPAGGRPGGPGGPGGGFGRRGGDGGGFNRAQWNLAFFVGSSKAQVQQEIREFQSADPNDDNKVYTYGAQMQMISSDTVTSVPDPRLQSWPGVKPVDPTATPAPAPAPATNAAPNTPDGTTPAAAPTGPPTVHTYLEALAAASNIWIMAPGSWAPEVASAPPASSSIISAVEKLVGGSHGFVTQAIVLRVGRGGARGPVANDDSWEDRMRNAINGLPPDERPDAIDQLNKEVDFRKSLAALPPEQRRQKMFEHFAEKMLYGERLSRLSPIKRAQAYKRMVAMRSPDKVAK